MRLEIDHHKCEGFGFCEEAAPETFGLDDEGYVTLRDPAAAPEDPAVASAIRVCPVGALRATT